MAHAVELGLGVPSLPRTAGLPVLPFGSHTGRSGFKYLSGKVSDYSIRIVHALLRLE